MSKAHAYRIRAAAAAVIGAVFFLAAMVTSAAAMGEELVGRIGRADNGHVLVADSGEYLLYGKPVADLAGKTVVVDGDVEYGATAKSIRVESARVLQAQNRTAEAMDGGPAHDG